MAECDTREILEALDYNELNALRRRVTWCGFGGRNSKKELLDSMNRAVGTAIGNGSLTPKELVEDIRDEVIYPGPNKIDTQIREVLRETEITNVAQNISDTEEFVCAHLTGVLQGKLGSRFKIEQERTVGTNKELDIWLKDEGTGGEYLIEAKIDKRWIKNLPEQLKKYHQYINNRQNTYVLFISFDRRYWEIYNENKEEQMKEFFNDSEAEEIRSIDNNIEIVLNLNPQ